MTSRFYCHAFHKRSDIFFLKGFGECGRYRYSIFNAAIYVEFPEDLRVHPSVGPLLLPPLPVFPQPRRRRLALLGESLRAGQVQPLGLQQQARKALVVGAGLDINDRERKRKTRALWWVTGSICDPSRTIRQGICCKKCEKGGYIAYIEETHLILNYFLY